MANQENTLKPLVSIVIINYNTSKVTIKAIETILQVTSYSPYEILIIDNASEIADQDDIKNFAESKSLPIQIMKENIGWTRAVNYAFSSVSGDLLLTINSDVMVEKGWLARMVDLYESEAHVGGVNANIYEAEKSIILAKNLYLKLLHGACALFSSDAWKLVGELDSKNFEFYGAENDWSYRARSMGYKLLFSKDSRVNHLGSSVITEGGGLSVKKSGKSAEFFKMRLDGRVKFRVYNFKLKDWISKQILYEFIEALKNGYLIILFLSYLRVLFNIKNVYLARNNRYLKMKHGVKILNSIDDN